MTCRLELKEISDGGGGRRENWAESLWIQTHRNKEDGSYSAGRTSKPGEKREGNPAGGIEAGDGQAGPGERLTDRSFVGFSVSLW